MRKQQAALISALLSLSTLETVVATEVAVCTDVGRIIIELNEDAAPLHAENFLRNVEEGYYTGTVFHRVIDGFMVQGGGFTRDLEYRGARSSVRNESRNGLSNARGTVAAARTGDPHSASTQFFVNTVDNRRLDASRAELGYTVFGNVTEGMDVVDQISALPTDAAGPFADDVPTPLIAVFGAAVLDREVLAEIDGPDLDAALLRRIAAAQETDEPEEALEWISHYRASCAPAGPDLLIAEASNAVAVNNDARARSALLEYFTTVSESHADYARAQELLAALASRQASIAAANVCAEPEAPFIPDGNEESMEGMLAAQSNVQAFMAASTDYLECMDELIEGDDLPQELRGGLIETYNDMVGMTQRIGDDFNAQVRAFRSRDDQ